MSRKTRTLFRILLAVYIGAILFLCFGKFPAGPEVDLTLWGIPTDKLVHFSMFFPFPILTYLSLGRHPETRRRILTIVQIFLIGILLAVATEWVQYYIPYRSGEWTDLFADSLGLLTSSLILLPFVCRKD